MTPTTPTGSLRISDVLPAAYWPPAIDVIARAAPAMKRNVSIALEMSSSATDVGFPVFHDSTAASAARLSATTSAIRCRFSERCRVVVRPQPLCAIVAAATASSTSAAVPATTVVITVSVAGLMTSIREFDDPARNSPPIKCPVVGGSAGYCSAPVGSAKVKVGSIMHVLVGGVTRQW